MGHHLIINGNAVYEIDLDCLKRKIQNTQNVRGKKKQEEQKKKEYKTDRKKHGM